MGTRIAPRRREQFLPAAVALAGVALFHALSMPLPFLLGPLFACLVAALAGLRLADTGRVGTAMRTVLGVIRPLSSPVCHEGSLAVLRGNLAPDGAVIKPAACDPRFHVHRGPAIVADSYAEMKAIIDDPDYPMTPAHVLVLRNAGPHGGPGMPEWGMIPMPKALLKDGHRDMVRLSDARMSGTSFGACVLHIAPEAFVGGPLALVETGDTISLDVPSRRLELEITDEEMARRRAAWQAPAPRYERGYRRSAMRSSGCCPMPRVSACRAFA